MTTTQDHPFLDLDRYRAQLGDPAKYFVDAGTPVPRVVAHATGEPAYVIDNAGVLRSWADYRAGKVPAAELPGHVPQPHVYTFGPRPAPRPPGVDAQSLPGKVSVGLQVK